MFACLRVSDTFQKISINFLHFRKGLCMNPAPTKCVTVAAAAVCAEATVDELLIFTCSVSTYDAAEQL